jgi:hypothetical protein
VLATRAPGCKPLGDVFLDLLVHRIGIVSTDRLPIQVSCYIGLVRDGVLEVFQGALVIATKRSLEDVVARVAYVILRSETTIILEDVGVSSRAITLIVYGVGLLLWAW